jgi:hypothetical protein
MASTPISSRTTDLTASQEPGTPPRPLSRLVSIALLVGVLIAALLYVFYLAARPDSRPLGSGIAHLAADSSGAVVAHVSQTSSSSWRALSVPEQTALEPLSGEWDKLDVTRQRKWLALADRFPRMTEVEQARTQERMREWVRLTPEERRVARETYLRAHSLPPEKRAELLQQYQQLPEEQKAELAEQARQHHSVMAVRVHPHEEPLPTKAQIREGARQPVPGLDMAKGTPAVSVATAPAVGSAPDTSNAVVTSTAPGSAASAPAAVSTSTAGGASSAPAAVATSSAGGSAPATVSTSTSAVTSSAPQAAPPPTSGVTNTATAHP